MPAPTNTSFTTATDLGASLPVTVTQTVDFAGTVSDPVAWRLLQAIIDVSPGVS